MKNMRNNPALLLVIAIPATAVLMGAISVFLAFGAPDRSVRDDTVPLSKTSWQTEP
jgi:hypothetical protein